MTSSRYRAPGRPARTHSSYSASAASISASSTCSELSTRLSTRCTVMSITVRHPTRRVRYFRFVAAKPGRLPDVQVELHGDLVAHLECAEESGVRRDPDPGLRHGGGPPEM